MEMFASNSSMQQSFTGFPSTGIHNPNDVDLDNVVSSLSESVNNVASTELGQASSVFVSAPSSSMNVQAVQARYLGHSAE